MFDLTDDQLAEYQLKWVYDFRGRSLRYADRYDICGALFEDLEAMFDDGVSKDDITPRGGISLRGRRAWCGLARWGPRGTIGN